MEALGEMLNGRGKEPPATAMHKVSRVGDPEKQVELVVVKMKSSDARHKQSRGDRPAVFVLSPQLRSAQLSAPMRSELCWLGCGELALSLVAELPCVDWERQSWERMRQDA